MIIYYVTDGCLEGAYRPTREAALKYAHDMLRQFADYTEPLEIWEYSLPEVTAEVLCNMANGFTDDRWVTGKQLLRRVWPREVAVQEA